MSFLQNQPRPLNLGIVDPNLNIYHSNRIIIYRMVIHLSLHPRYLDPEGPR